MTRLQDVVDRTGKIPVGWACGFGDFDHVNIGDALSPVMVALCTGLDVEPVHFKTHRTRLAAVGTIAHGFAGGEFWTWGTGTSRYLDPDTDRTTPYAPPADTRMHVCAVRGPVTRGILTGRNRLDRGGIFGDPVWLLPRFYNPPIVPTYELGVIVHISELTGRAPDSTVRPDLTRYAIPADLAGSVRIIHTMTDPTADSMRDKIDEILTCKRILSTSLHGLVFAESYGRPCLHFQPSAGEIGVFEIPLAMDAQLDLRMIDLYLGVGASKVPVFRQPLRVATDWQAVIEAIDDAWEPRRIDEAALIDALPITPAPVTAPPGGTVFDLPVIRALPIRTIPQPPRPLIVRRFKSLVRGLRPS